MKCKNCKIKVEKENLIYAGINYFCSKKCRLELWRAEVKKTKAKEKAKKKKQKEKKQNSISYLTKKADKLWSEAVKIEYNYECQVEWCDKTQYLNSHHLYTRARKSTRWNIENWICLCAWHHTLSSQFSAHQTPLEFFEWLEWVKWRDWINEMSAKSREICNVTPDLIKEHIKSLEEYINNYK